MTYESAAKRMQAWLEDALTRPIAHWVSDPKRTPDPAARRQYEAERQRQKRYRERMRENDHMDTD